MRYRNPIIAGFNPDPAICRHGKDFYLVTSSFEYFPGVPIYHSTNLADWTLEGYCLTEYKQLPLDNCPPSGGIYAPTIYFHDGIYYVTTTNTNDMGNFIVFAENIHGPWSKPIKIDQEGIDPSILFDDGHIYYLTSASDQNGKPAILMSQIDISSGIRLTEAVCISHGCGGKYPEAPHLYKKDGIYYLLMAEGGTEYGHMVTIQRSGNPYGPYEPCPHNPILSHRDDMRGDICCTGHGDLIEDENGRWWMVCLGIRPCSSPQKGSVMLHHLGRETFLAPVTWADDGWPHVGNNGRLALEMDAELPGEAVRGISSDFYDNFENPQMKKSYTFLRNPVMENYKVDWQQQCLMLTGSDVTLNDIGSPTWIGIRQKAFKMEASVKMCLAGDGPGRAGITAYYNKDYHYDLFAERKDGKLLVALGRHIHDFYAVTALQIIDVSDYLSSERELELRIQTDKDVYRFEYRETGKTFRLLDTAATAGLCTEGTWVNTFTGTFIALFAEQTEARFRQFYVREI